MRFYRVVEDEAARYTGDLSNTQHKWGLPGMRCPACDITGGAMGLFYPCVDLSGLPDRELKRLSDAGAVSMEEFARLRALVRPLAPEDAVLEPGTEFGPLTGTATGSFGPLSMLNSWALLAQREALERLQAEGLGGLQGCPLDVRFRSKRAPELWELQLRVQGRLHSDCLPPERSPPCPTCGRTWFTRPATYWLEAASLPQHVDVFRLLDFPTVILATERVVEAVQRLGLDGVAFHEVETR